MSTEIFRFTTVRPPQLSEISEAKGNYIYIFKPEEESDFLKKLRIARKLSLERMISEAEVYTKEQTYIKSFNDVLTSYATFSDYLLRNPNETDVYKIREVIENSFNSSVGRLVLSDTFKGVRNSVSDSLLSSLVLGNISLQIQNNQVRLLQIIGLIEKIGILQTGNLSLSQLLSSSIVLPKGIFPLPYKEETIKDEIIERNKEEERQKKEKAEERRNTISEIEKLKSAFSELQSAMEEEKVQVNASENPRERITRRGFYLGSDSANKLSQNTRAVVDSLNFKLQSLDTSVLLPKLETKISTLSQKLFENVNFDSRVVRIGNSFVVDSPPMFNGGEVKYLEMMGSCPENTRLLEEEKKGSFVPNSKGKVHVLGIMDLLLVEQELIHYEKGEIAHIENVLIGETRERSHRRTLTTEESLLTETEITEEREKDLTSTERYELQTESQKVIEESRSLEAGVTANVYGVRWDASASTNVAASKSTTESNASSSSFAREVTERAANRVTNRTLERRMRRTLEEIQEKNLHSFNNAGGQDHITGIYRWLDKMYKAQVVNYGERLMLEFVVPEPSAFYRYALTQQPVENNTLFKPEEPGYCVGGKTFRPLRTKDLTRANYLIWANKYNASNVMPPPSTYQITGESFSKERKDLYVGQFKRVDGMKVYKDDKFFNAEKVNLQIPEGYKPENAKVMVDFNYVDIPNEKGEDFARITVTIEDKQHTFRTDDEADVSKRKNETNLNNFINSMTFPISTYSTLNLPITITSCAVESFGLTVTVLCKLSDEKFEEWQLKTYTAIMEAYNEQKARYESQLEASRIEQGFGNITGQNPIFNRETEKTELKKGCITLLTGQRFEDFNSVQKNVGKYGYPEIVSSDAEAEGRYIKFFEQSIEWANMLYVFYPYFWAEKSQWVQLSQLDDDDALFTKFLQAGAARVQVPVRPGFNYSMLTYLQTGQIWEVEGKFIDVNEDGVPDILQISILDELKEGALKSHNNSKGEPVNEPWTIRVPTSLLVIDDYKKLSDEGYIV